MSFLENFVSRCLLSDQSKAMRLLFILCIAISLFLQMEAYRGMRSKKKPTSIGPTCTQGGHNPLPPSGICPQSNETFTFPGLFSIHQITVQSALF